MIYTDGRPTIANDFSVRAPACDDLLTLCRRAENGDEQARETLYDDHGVNDEDRDALLAHQARHYVGWANGFDNRAR